MTFLRDVVEYLHFYVRRWCCRIFTFFGDISTSEDDDVEYLRFFGDISTSEDDVVEYLRFFGDISTSEDDDVEYLPFLVTFLRQKMMLFAFDSISL